MDFDRLSLIYTDLHGFIWIYVDLHGFSWICEVLEPECLAACGSLCLPVAPCGNGLDPLYIKISDSGGLDLEAWMLDAGRIGMDWRR